MDVHPDTPDAIDTLPYDEPIKAEDEERKEIGGEESKVKAKSLPKKKWTAQDLKQYDMEAPVFDTKTYRIAYYINKQDKHLFSNIPAVSIPLSVVCSRATHSMLLEIGQKHGVSSQRKGISLATIVNTLSSHRCVTCPEFLTVFEPNKEALTEAQRSKLYRLKNATVLKPKECERYQSHENDYYEKMKESKREKYKESLFPPKPATRKLMSDIIKNFIEGTSFKQLEEYGCAVCGALTSINKLDLLSEINQNDLSCLVVPEVTRQERLWKKEDIGDIPGPVIDKDCKHICIKCHNSIKEGKVPQLALANGLWLGKVPVQLQDV